MIHAQEQRSGRFAFNVGEPLAWTFSKQPWHQRTEKCDRSCVQDKMGGRKCSTQPKHPEVDGTDGKGFDNNNNNDSVLLRNDTKPYSRSTPSSSLEIKMLVGRLFKTQGILFLSWGDRIKCCMIQVLHTSGCMQLQFPHKSYFKPRYSEGRAVKGLEIL